MPDFVSCRVQSSMFRVAGLCWSVAAYSPSRSGLIAASDRHGHERENDALRLTCSLDGDRRPMPIAAPLSVSSPVVCWCCNNCQNSASSSWIPRIVRPAAGPTLLVREMTALPNAAAPPRNVETLCSDEVVERRSEDVDDQNAELSDADGTTVRCLVRTVRCRRRCDVC